MIQIYSTFFEQIEKEFPSAINDDFLIAYISSPYKKSFNNVNNEYFVTYYLINLKTKSVHLFEHAWRSLSYAMIGHYINKNTKHELTYPWETRNHKEKQEYIKHFIVNLDAEIYFITLQQFYKKYKLYKKLFTKKENLYEFSTETLVVYEEENQTIIIPSIVLVQALYTKSNKDSLFDSLIRPLGINSMISSCIKKDTVVGEKENYHLVMTGNSHIEDRGMLFYFFHNDTQKNYLNILSSQIKERSKIKVKIPKSNGIFNMEAEYSLLDENKQIYYIRNILKSNLIDDDVNNKSFTFYHPKSVFKKTENSNKDSNYDKTMKKNKIDGKVNNQQKVSSNDSTIDMGLNLNSVGSESFESMQIRTKREQDSGGKVLIEEGTEIMASTFMIRGSSKGMAKGIESKIIEELDNKDDLWFLPALKELEKYFTIDDTRVEPLPIHKKKYICSFMDNSRKKNRKYVVIQASDDNTSFIYIDIENDTSNRCKSILLINRFDMKTPVEYLVDKIMEAQIDWWSKPWENNSVLTDYPSSFTYKHGRDVSVNIKGLKRKILKQFTLRDRS